LTHTTLHRDHIPIYHTHLLQLLTLIIFLFTHTPTTHIYTLSLHDALPISVVNRPSLLIADEPTANLDAESASRILEIFVAFNQRSEEHTSELQSRENLVCRLLLEKKKKIINRKICVSSVFSPFLNHRTSWL